MSVADIRRKRKEGIELEGVESNSNSRVEAIREKRRQGIELDKGNAVNPDFSFVSDGNANLTIRNRPTSQAPTTDITSRRNPDSNKDAYRMAVELAKKETSSNSAETNAGDNRITAVSAEPKTIQQINTWGGYNAANPTYAGINTAANGADVDYTEINKTATENGKGWQGLGNFLRGGEKAVPEEVSLENAQKVVNPYINNEKLKGILDRYAQLEYGRDVANASSGNRWVDVYGFALKDQYKELKEEFQKETGVSDEEYERIAENYKYVANSNAAKEFQSTIDEKPLAEKIAIAPLTLMEDITGNAQGLFSIKDSKTDDSNLGRDYNSGSFAARNFAQAVNSSIRKDIQGYTDESGNRVKGIVDDEEHPVLSELTMDLYNLPYMSAESIITALYPGKLGTAIYASGAFTSGVQEAENRGLSERQSLTFGATVGTAEYVLERTPLAHLSELFSGNVSKKTLKSFLIRQMREEGQEEIGGDIVDVIADALIAGDKSKLNQSIDYYSSQEYADKYNNGVLLSKEEAKRKAWTEWGIDAVHDYVLAAGSAGLSTGAGASVNSIIDTSLGRKIARDQQFNASIVRDTESPNYISDKREDYNSDEEYEAAQETRQAILDSSERAAKGQRVSGKAARAITSGIREAYDSLDARSRVVYQQQIEAAQKEAEDNAIEKINNAKSAAEVETIREKFAGNENVAAAVEEKKAQMVEAGEATTDDFTNAITPIKARELAKKGEEIKKEELEQLPEEVQDAYNIGYNERAHEVTKNISNVDVTNIQRKGTTKVEKIKSVSANQNEIVFETESGATIPASEVQFNNRAKYLYEGENGILSLNNAALAQLAIDVEAESSHGISVANVTMPIKTMYTQGAAGLDFEAAYKSLGYQAKAVSKDVLRKAFEEGQKESKATARATTNVRKSKGLVIAQSEDNDTAYKAQFKDSKGNYSEEVQTKYENEVSDTEKKFLELLSKKIGVDIRFTSDNSGNRGEYKPNEGAIYLNLNNGINMFEVALHEGIGEFLAASNEKAYNQIADSVLNAYAAINANKLASDIRAYQKAYSEDKYGDTARGASRELFNDALGEILSLESNLKKMFDWMVTNEGEAQAQKVKKTLVDYFHDLVDMIKSIKKLGGLTRLERNRMRLSEEQANQYADMIFKAMDEAIANRDAEAASNSDLKDENSRQSLDMYHAVEYSEKKYIDSEILARIKHKENTTFNTKDGNIGIRNNRSIYIVKLVEGTEDGYDIEYIYDVLVDEKDSTQTTILMEAIEEFEKGDKYGAISRESFGKLCVGLRSTHLSAGDSIRIYGLRTGKVYTRFRLGKTGKVLQSDHKSYRVGSNRKTNFDQRTGYSRNSLEVDTEGRSLSEGQQEYFADSKIRDEQGRLMVVYHGTPYGGFTVFKNELNYYTTNKEYAERYQDPSASSNPRRKDAATSAMTYEGYLNITKPFDIEDPETREIFINEYVKGGYALGINPYISDAEIEKQIENGVDWTEAENLLEFIQDNEYDYDGLILDEGGNFDDNGDVNYRGKSYVTFNSNQFKNADNKNPTVDADIRKSIKVDWDTHNSYKVPARTYDDLVGFNGTDEEIEAAEQQDLAVKAYYANIIHSKGFAGLMFEYKDGSRVKQNFLTRSTREGYDWQYSYGFDNEPHGHNNYKDVNDVVEPYGNVWGDDMTSLYQELLDATPREGIDVHVVREGIAEEGRKSKAVFGEASPYSETIQQSEYVSKVLSILNNQLKGTTVNINYIKDTVSFILDRYKSNLNENDFTMELAEFIAYMTSQDNVDYNQMMNYLMNLGDEVIKSSQLKDPESERVYSELKKELSSHKIRLNEKERKELTARFGGDWKAVFGKLNSIGIKLDSKNGQQMDAGIYTEIANKFSQLGGVYLDESVTPVDQIATIIDAMDAMQPTAYEWEGANDMDKALDVATTIIDRYYSMATAIKEANIVKGNEKGAAAVERAKQAEIKKLRKRQAEWKEKLNADFAALVEDKKKMVAEQQEFYRKQAEAEKKFRGEQRKFNQKVNMTEKEMERTAKVLAKMEYQGLKDTESKRKYKDNIVRTSMRLINWMNKPTDARHVPTFLKPALADMIKSIDFMPASMRKGEDGTISAQKWQTSMRKLQQVLSGINAQSMESMDDSDKYNLALVLNAEDVVVKMDQLLNKYSGTADISKMSKEDLKTLSDIMTSISKGISQMNDNFMNRRFKHVSDAALAAMDEMDSLKPISDNMNVARAKAADLLNLDMLDPYTFFHELGEASKTIMQEFYDGEKIGVEIIRESEDFFTKLSSKLGVTQKDLRDWENDRKEYTFDGNKITLTPAEIMSLYCSYNREKLDQEQRPFEATHHIMSGGIKGYERKIGVGPKATIVNRNARVMHLNEGQILELINSLSAEQIAYADEVVEYMSTTLAAHGNETSNKISGYSKFLGQKYFPLKTDTNTIKTNESNSETGLEGLMRFIHPSFTKAQLDKADNALVLVNFFDVVTEHITGMSNYCAYAMPLSDAMRWYNFAETERNNTDVEDVYWRKTRTLKDSMVKVKGKGAKTYFENFLRDVNLDPANKGGSKFVDAAAKALTGLGRAKAIGLNLSVWLQQPTAIVRASDVIESKYLVQGISKMMKHPLQSAKYAQATNYLCYWKNKGFSDYRVTMGMKEIITGYNTKLQAAQEKAGAPAGIMDDVTWAAMYYAAENKIKDTTKLDENSQEYRTAVDELFSEIINQTQVIDSTLRTTQTMRSKNDFEYLANAFKKEPQKSYNMLHRAAFDVKQAQTESQKVEADKRFRRTLKAFLLTSLVNGMVVAAVQAWRDDEDENYLLKWFKKLIPYGSYKAIKDALEDGKLEGKELLPLLQGIWGGIGTVGDNADILSAIPLLAEADSWLKGYEPSSINHLSILSEAVKTVKALTSNNPTEYKIAYSIASLQDYVTGLGISNAMRDIRGIWNQSTRLTGLPRIEKSEKAKYDNEKKSLLEDLDKAFDESKNVQSIYAAVDAIYQFKYDGYISDGKDEEYATKEGKEQAGNLIRDTYKDEYIDMYEENPMSVSNLRTNLIYAYKRLGYDEKAAVKKVDGWVK